MSSAINGILLLDKPEGITSAAVLNRIKYGLKIKKIGHAGTLDPMATGLLVCLLGAATRLAKYAEGGKKRYTGTIRLGITTSSDDITGEILSQNTQLPKFEQVLAAAGSFVGKIEQTPPQVSAIKVDGERSYDLARKGVAVELKSRQVEIYSLSIKELSEQEVGFDISCSKGTYIRSIARDLGALLGCGATLSSLRREESAPFSVSDAHSLTELSLNHHLLPLTAMFPGEEPVLLESDLARKIRGGDERALFELESSAAGVGIKSRGRALYGERSAPENLLGLIEFSLDRLRIGINF